MLKRLTGGDGPLGGLNSDFDGEALKAALQTVWQDLRAKRLLPVAALLLVGLIAVPVLLSSSPSSSAQTTPVVAVPPPVPGLPAVTQRLVPAAELRHTGHDPFAPQPGTSTTAATSTPSGGTSTGPVSTGAGNAVSTTGSGTTPPGSGSSRLWLLMAASGGNGSGGNGSGGNGSGGKGSGGKGSGGKGSGGSPPSDGELGPRQSYAVKLAITTTGGGITTFDPLTRLSVLPSPQQPLMVELGVLKGGQKVLFALEPGTIVSGKGQCIPGPIDCQIVALGRNQVEDLAVKSSTGITSVALFAVTGISVVTHDTASEAQTGPPGRVGGRSGPPGPDEPERAVALPVRAEHRRCRG